MLIIERFSGNIAVCTSIRLLAVDYVCGKFIVSVVIVDVCVCELLSYRYLRVNMFTVKHSCICFFV